MSLLFFDGFETESYVGVKWSSTAAGASVARAIDYKRSGNASFKFSKDAASSNYALIWKNFETSVNTLICGFAVRFSRVSSNNQQFFRIGEKSGSRLAYLYTNSSNQLYATVNGLGTVATGSLMFGINTQYYLQVKMTCDATNGSLVVQVGTQTDITATGLNLSSSGNITDQIAFYLATTDSNVQYMQIDDVYVVNSDATTPNDFMGTCSVQGVLPDAVGDRNDFNTQGAVQAYNAVNELGVDTVTYVYGDALNEKVLFSFPDITTSNEIKAIIINDYSARSEAGSGTTKYKMVLRNDADSEQMSSEISLPDSNQRLHSVILSKNPITDTTQTQSTVNELQIGAIITQVN